MPIIPKPFQLTAARRRLELNLLTVLPLVLVSTHSRPKAAGDFRVAARRRHMVSTHSRPKAAGPANGLLFTALKSFQLTAARRQLETYLVPNLPLELRFNSQPPEGSWPQKRGVEQAYRVSTHSRPKAAGLPFSRRLCGRAVSTHSRPKAAGCFTNQNKPQRDVSTHSRPKAAGGTRLSLYCTARVSTHSRPKAAG